MGAGPCAPLTPRSSSLAASLRSCCVCDASFSTISCETCNFTIRFRRGGVARLGGFVRLARRHGCSWQRGWIPAAYPIRSSSFFIQEPLLTIQCMRAHGRRHGSYTMVTHPGGSGPRCQRHAGRVGGHPVLHALICLCVARFVHALCVFRLCSGEWRDPPAMVRRAAEAEHVHPGTVLGWGAGTVCTRIADSSRRSSHSQRRQ